MRSLSAFDTRNNTPQWLQSLFDRGFSPDAIERAGLKAHRRGWLYPIAPAASARRWKAFPGQQGPKYLWKPQQPDNVRFYDPVGDLAQHIAAADGALNLASGEPDVWAVWTAGAFNVTATMQGEGVIPAWFVDELRRLKVQRVIIYPDRDQAGEKHARKVGAALQGSGIALEVYALPFDMGSKGDVNALLLDVGAAGLLPALQGCPAWDIEPEPAPSTPEAPQKGDLPAFDLPSDASELLEIETRTRAEIARALEKRGSKPGVYCCPLEHGPAGKDFLFNPEPGTPIGGCMGKHRGDLTRWVDLAAHLDIDVSRIAADVARERRPNKKPSNASLQNLSDTIEPVTLPAFDAHKTVNLRYVSDIPAADVLEHRAVLIKSPLSTGKTELVKRVIANLDQKTPASVLVITHRQALAADIAARLELECYKVMPDDRLDQAHRLVISYNSLHKIGVKRRWDLVVIDEIEQFNQHLFGGTFRGGEAYNAHSALVKVLRNAKHFIGLDAHLSDVSARWLHSAIGAAPFLIENAHRHNWGRLTLHARESAALSAAIKAAKADRGPVVITTSSRKRSDVYYQLVCDAIGADGVRLVNGENSSNQDTQRFIENINRDLRQLRVLICTPSFGTGLDVTAPVYGVFGIMLNRPLIATDMLQMLGRFRNAEHRAVYVQHLHYGKPRDWLDRYGDAIEASADTRQRADFAAYGVPAVAPDHHHILRLESQLRAAGDVQKTDLVSYFAAYAIAEGFELAFDDTRDHAMQKAITAAREAIAEAQKQRVLAAAPVTPEEYEQHQMDGTVTPEVSAGYERWKIEHTVGLSLTSTIYDDLHRSDRRAALRRLADLLTDVNRLQERDRGEALENVLLTQRGHYTTTRDLIHAGLSAVFGTDYLSAAATLTADDIKTRLTSWLDRNLEQVQRMLDRRDDLSRDPLFVLRRLLRAAGLKLARRQVMHDGKRFMVYWLDADHRDQWLAYARARLAHLANIEAITTNPEIDKPFRVCSHSAPKQHTGEGQGGQLLDLVVSMMRGECHTLYPATI